MAEECVRALDIFSFFLIVINTFFTFCCKNENQNKAKLWQCFVNADVTLEMYLQGLATVGHKYSWLAFESCSHSIGQISSAPLDRKLCSLRSPQPLRGLFLFPTQVSDSLLLGCAHYPPSFWRISSSQKSGRSPELVVMLWLPSFIPA